MFSTSEYQDVVTIVSPPKLSCMAANFMKIKEAFFEFDEVSELLNIFSTFI